MIAFSIVREPTSFGNCDLVHNSTRANRVSAVQILGLKMSVNLSTESQSGRGTSFCQFSMMCLWQLTAHLSISLAISANLVKAYNYVTIAWRFASVSRVSDI